AAFHRKTQARWRVLWAAAGRDEAPDPEHLEAQLDELLGAHRATMADAARLDEAEERRAAAVIAQRPLVLVEPSTWWEPGRLDQLLTSLPPGGDVVIVERARRTGRDDGPDDGKG
ncbi:MAG: hypothetical protein M3527_08720, partial [Actinomycetota bacterium]|nr:hypothetical protein [Actinomycetota bacterium]